MLCSDALEAAPKAWSTSFAAMGCWFVMGAQEMGRQTCQGHHHLPFQGNEKIRIKLEWCCEDPWGEWVALVAQESLYVQRNPWTKSCSVLGQCVGFLQIGVGCFLRGGSSKVAPSGGLPGIPSQGAQVFINEVVVNFVHPWLFVSSVSSTHDDVW